MAFSSESTTVILTKVPQKLGTVPVDKAGIRRQTTHIGISVPFYGNENEE
jgi:hypothetical protein